MQKKQKQPSFGSFLCRGGNGTTFENENLGNLKLNLQFANENPQKGNCVEWIFVADTGKPS